MFEESQIAKKKIQKIAVIYWKESRRVVNPGRINRKENQCEERQVNYFTQNTYNTRMTKKDFPEARESLYWIDLLHRNDYLDDKQYKSIYNDAEELVKILVTRCKKLNQETLNKEDEKE